MKETRVIKESEMKETITNFLIYLSLFNGFDDYELSVVSEHMTFLELEKDEVLFKEGDKGEYVCFVVDGKMDVMKKGSKGEDVVIATLAKGRSIGEMSVIDDTPRSATARAATKTTLAKLTVGDFDLILKDFPKIGIKILKGITRLLSRNLRKTSSQLVEQMLPII